MNRQDALVAALNAERDSAGCAHPLLSLPAFDEGAARGLPAQEVRRRWPRNHARCPDCDAGVLSYASVAHFVAGDW